jgi:hypothetical protein
VLYREPIGKWDAINFGSKFIPPEAELIIVNDVDTQIHGLAFAMSHCKEFDLIFCRVEVQEGPQNKFYRILDQVRAKLPIAASGELMLINRQLFERILPIPPCTAEDTVLLFRALNLRRSVRFCKEAFVVTQRTASPAEEQLYKTRTTLGIYQALRFEQAPSTIRAFYMMLPLFAPLLFLSGADGRAWTMGIERATVKHLLRQYASRF